MKKFIKKSDEHIELSFKGRTIIKCGYDKCMSYYIGYYIIVESYGVVYRATTSYNIESGFMNCEIETARF